MPELAASLLSAAQEPGGDIDCLQDHAVVCFSHLRWDLVFQRPQHLMTRFARRMPVYFVEESAFEGGRQPFLQRYQVGDNVTVLVPHMPESMPQGAAALCENRLLAEFCAREGIAAPMLWFYTPAALHYADALPSAVTVYDCMDELSAFHDAPPALCRLEAALLRRVDLVFTGGISLYEAKRDRHPEVHSFPSAVDAAHFGRARQPQAEPPDQAAIPHPRLGFFGVIDERLDRDLVAEVARLRPDWQLIFVGPVVKIDPATLPRATNIHYLGGKKYGELPWYIASWDAAVMPFAQNRATRFISPTKTPEYLAAGKPVVSTPIVDVVRSWGHLEAVRIAAAPDDFVGAAGAALALAGNGREWLIPVDAALDRISWDRTWEQMAGLTAAALASRLPRFSRRRQIKRVTDAVSGNAGV